MARLRAGAALMAVLGVLAGCASDGGGPADFARSVDVGGRSVYLTCHGTAEAGEPTVVLVSGYHDSSDVWTASDVLGLVGAATGPPVFPALAAAHRVCAYDRPGTLRYVDGAPLTDRSTPVAQPRTARDLVAELHDVLAAAGIAAPYVVVGHSLGGLIARAYAQAHADQVHGVVFVDAFSASIPALFGARWAIYRDQGLNPPVEQMPVASMRSPDSERVDLDASIAEVLAGPAFPKIPVAVLTKTEPFAGLKSFPGLPADETNRLYEQAEDDYVALVADTPQMIATGSDHYIQFSQPDLVVRATELVEQRAAVRP
ncbi:MAG TPA: alpha/beta fold hydrolase [Mycobacterium sp.]|nr:alpha/beta fold hydrolase [Mycobacterium sp.]